MGRLQELQKHLKEQEKLKKELTPWYEKYASCCMEITITKLSIEHEKETNNEN